MYKKLISGVLVLAMLFLFAVPALAASSDPAPIDYRIATTAVNVRTGPSSAKYPATGALKKGEVVQYVGKSGTWSKILYNGKTAYVYSQYLNIVPVSYRVATTAVNVRTGPSSTKYPAIGYLKTGESVQYIGKYGSWSVVSYKGRLAYVFSKYLVEKSSGTPQKEVKASAENGTLKLELIVDKGTYKANEPIQVRAILKNISSRSSVDVYGTKHLVYFPITGGNFNGEYPTTLELAKTTIKKGTPIEYKFVKVGCVSPDADEDFAKAYFADSKLRLPAGTYEIEAEMRYSPSLSSPARTLRASVTITVK